MIKLRTQVTVFEALNRGRHACLAPEKHAERQRPQRRLLLSFALLSLPFFALRLSFLLRSFQWQNSLGQALLAGLVLSRLCILMTHCVWTVVPKDPQSLSRRAVLLRDTEGPDVTECHLKQRAAPVPCCPDKECCGGGLCADSQAWAWSAQTPCDVQPTSWGAGRDEWVFIEHLLGARPQGSGHVAPLCSRGPQGEYPCRHSTHAASETQRGAVLSYGKATAGSGRAMVLGAPRAPCCLSESRRAPVPGAGSGSGRSLPRVGPCVAVTGKARRFCPVRNKGSDSHPPCGPGPAPPQRDPQQRYWDSREQLRGTCPRSYGSCGARWRSWLCSAACWPSSTVGTASLCRGPSGWVPTSIIERDPMGPSL